MRVTILLRCLAMMHGGGETRHLAWARELRRLGDEVTIITGRPLLTQARYGVDASTVVLRSPYVRDLVYRLQHTRGFGRLTSQMLHADEEWFCRAAWRHIEASSARPDIVHAHALSQAARLRRQEIPTIVNLPGMPHRRYFSDLRGADALVADGWAAHHLPAALGCTVHNVPKGVDTDTFQPDGPDLRAANGLEQRRVVLVVSRLVPIKNVGLAIDALGRLARTHPNVTLVVAGDGPLRHALEARATDLGIRDSVRFLGAVPHAQIPSWYRSADLFVLPSEFDNSPNVVLEAMASGLPVVATDVGGLRDFVEEGVHGALVAPASADALAAGMEPYLGDLELARRVSLRNRADAVNRFSWAQSARALRDVYRGVIAHRQDDRHRPYQASA